MPHGKACGETGAKFLHILEPLPAVYEDFCIFPVLPEVMHPTNTPDLRAQPSMDDRFAPDAHVWTPDSSNRESLSLFLRRQPWKHVEIARRYREYSFRETGICPLPLTLASFSVHQLQQHPPLVTRCTAYVQLHVEEVEGSEHQLVRSTLMSPWARCGTASWLHKTMFERGSCGK